MTPLQRELAYAASRKVALSQLSRADAIQQIAASEVPKGSAAILVDVFQALRNGATFKRALSEADMDRFLDGICTDDGVETLASALNGFAKHISYRESVGNVQPGNRALYATYLARITVPGPGMGGIGSASDPFEDEVRRSREDSSQLRQKRLQTARKMPRRVPKIVFVFERDPDVVAEVLEQAAGVCGICRGAAPFPRASDGSPYLEVHHRLPLAKGGEDTVENAVAACPNCHREQHYG